MERFKLITEDLLESGAPEGPWLDKMVRLLNSHMEQAYTAFGQKLQLEAITVDVTTKSTTATLSPINGWTTYTGFTPPSLEKSGGGVVDLEGRLAPGTTGTVALQLPADFWPDRVHRVPLSQSGTQECSAEVGTNGAVVVNFQGAAPTWIDLGGAIWTASDKHAALNSAFPIKVKTSIQKVSGVLVSKSQALSHPHVGASLGVEWHMDGAALVVDSINGLTPGQSFKITLRILGNLG